MPKANSGNHAKYLSYTLAHSRMKAALDAGFPLETIAIAESVMTDRLLSFVNHHGGALDPERTTLGQVAPRAEQLCRQAQDEQGATLAEQARQWAHKRNAILHAIAKSGQGVGPRIPAEAFVAEADSVARQGVELLKHIKAWHQQQVRQATATRNRG